MYTKSLISILSLTISATAMTATINAAAQPEIMPSIVLTKELKTKAAKAARSAAVSAETSLEEAQLEEAKAIEAEGLAQIISRIRAATIESDIESDIESEKENKAIKAEALEAAKARLISAQQKVSEAIMELRAANENAIKLGLEASRESAFPAFQFPEESE